MIRLGVIGFGRRMRDLFENILQNMCDVQIVGIVDFDHKAIERAPEKFRNKITLYSDVASMFRHEKIDGVMVGTRCDNHADYAIEVSKYHVPIFLEKPVCNTENQALKLKKHFMENKCEVVVSFPLIFTPLFEEVKDRLHASDFGDIQHILSYNYVPYGTVYWEQEYKNYEITGGLLLQKATHDFDYISRLLKSPINRVAATATYGKVFGGNELENLRCSTCNKTKECLESPYNRNKNFSGGTLDDHDCVFSVACGDEKTGMNEDSTSVLFECESGIHGLYTQVFFSRRSAELRGSRVSSYYSTMDFDWYNGKIEQIYHHKPVDEAKKVKEKGFHFGGDLRLIENFLDVIRGEAKSKSTIWDGLRSVFICLAARESLKIGSFVEVHNFDYI